MKKLSLLSLLIVLVVSPAMADVASTANVDAMRADVQTKIDALANNSGYTANRVLQTDGEGKVTAGLLKTDMIADGAIQTMHIADGTVTDADLAAGLGLDKLDWGTLPTDGNLYIPIWNSATNMYVFEFYDYVSTGLQCTAPEYDVGADMCISKDTAPDVYGYWDFSAASAWDCPTCKVKGDWEVRYTSGAYAGTTLTGKALCSSTGGTYTVVGNPDESGSGTTSNCWCKLDNGSAVSHWVFRKGTSYASNCANYCAYDCADYVQYDDDFRSAMFESVTKSEPEPEPQEPAGLQCTDSTYNVGADMCISTDTNANVYGYWNHSAASADNCTTCNAKGDWEVRYTSGTYAGTTLTGKALCSNTNGTFAVAGSPNETQGSGRYCWCKLDNDTAVSQWVFHNGNGNLSYCENGCASNCGYYVQNDAGFRSAVFGSVGQN